MPISIDNVSLLILCGTAAAIVSLVLMYLHMGRPQPATESAYEEVNRQWRHLVTCVSVGSRRRWIVAVVRGVGSCLLAYVRFKRKNTLGVFDLGIVTLLFTTVVAVASPSAWDLAIRVFDWLTHSGAGA
jgi:hypothetical protein